jgi:AhpD family alkylhydroperoxidase
MRDNQARNRVRQIVENRAKNQKRLENEAPLLSGGFKELIAIALSISRCCIPCLAVHTRNAVDAGATREEVIDAAKIGVGFGGGPSFVVVRNNLLEFLDELVPA